MRENSNIYNNISIVHDPVSIGKLQIMTKLPSLPKDGLCKNNYNAVVNEMDRKMKKISKPDCEALQAEIDKGIKNGFLVKLKDLSPETQANIQNSPSLQYVSVAPSLQSLIFINSRQDHLQVIPPRQ